MDVVRLPLELVPTQYTMQSLKILRCKHRLLVVKSFHYRCSRPTDDGDKTGSPDRARQLHCLVGYRRVVSVEKSSLLSAWPGSELRRRFSYLVWRISGLVWWWRRRSESAALPAPT
jgi:hypothetical protein